MVFFIRITHTTLSFEEGLLGAEDNHTGYLSVPMTASQGFVKTIGAKVY